MKVSTHPDGQKVSCSRKDSDNSYKHPPENFSEIPTYGKYILYPNPTPDHDDLRVIRKMLLRMLVDTKRSLNKTRVFDLRFFREDNHVHPYDREVLCSQHGWKARMV